jgi:hypothetical protein
VTSAAKNPMTTRTLRWFHQQVAAGKRIAEGYESSPIPRGELAARLRQFVAVFDRERAWDAAGELGEPLRVRALELADVLERQHARTR